MTAHYPTTAELAAHRRSIAPEVPNTTGGFPWPNMKDGQGRSMFLLVSPANGAWPHEREQGIGWFAWALWVDSAGVAISPDAAWAIARREASRLRSEQFGEDVQHARLVSDPAEAADWNAAVERFAPEPDHGAVCPSCNQAYRIDGHHSDCWLHP